MFPTQADAMRACSQALSFIPDTHRHLFSSTFKQIAPPSLPKSWIFELRGGYAGLVLFPLGERGQVVSFGCTMEWFPDPSGEFTCLHPSLAAHFMHENPWIAVQGKLNQVKEFVSKISDRVYVLDVMLGDSEAWSCR